MPKVDYRIVSNRTLLEEYPDFEPEPGFHEDSKSTWFEDWDAWVIRFEDDVPVSGIGSDGGEPEDQTLGRDWSWVAPALQSAYEDGLFEGMQL